MPEVEPCVASLPHKRLELTEEEYLVLKQQRLYNDAAELLVTLCSANPDWYGLAKGRGIWPETCEKFAIGTVPWPSLIAALKNLGWDEGFVRSSGIDDHHFGERFLTFTLRNMNGKVVGFDRRYMDYDPEVYKAHRSAGVFYPPKYMATDQKKCRLIHKDALLLNIHWARDRPLRRLDVFEGFTDFYTAYQSGHQCCTAVCGSHLTEMMVAVIRSCGFSHVNLVYDSDDTGVSKMEEALEKFKEQEGLHITIMPLSFAPEVPPNSRDVDFYIRAWSSLEEGLANFLRHQPVSAFDWLLERRIAEGGEPSIIAKEMVGFIVNERSQVDRGILCQLLANRLAIPEQDVRAEVEMIANQKLDEICSMAAVRIGRATSTAARIGALEAGYETLRAVQANQTDAANDPVESVTFMRDTIENFRATEKGFLGWETGWPHFDSATSGIPKAKQIIVFGGLPNVGKSSLLMNFSSRIIDHNQEPTVIFFSLDDPRETAQAKFMALMCGMPIMHMTQPREYIFGDTRKTAIYDQACEKMMSWGEEGRLVLKGLESGNSVESFENVIRRTQERLGRPCIVMVDSFHSVRGAGESERINFVRVAEWCQRVTDQLNVTLVCTAECSKEATNHPRPRMAHLGETGKIAYAAKLVGMVHNEKHFKFNRTNWVWDDEGTPRSILEVDVEKNKITSYKDTWYWRMREPTAELFESDRATLTASTSRAVKANDLIPPGTPKDASGPPRRSEGRV